MQLPVLIFKKYLHNIFDKKKKNEIIYLKKHYGYDCELNKD